MSRDAQLARVEQGQVVQTMLLIYIAVQVGWFGSAGSAWSTADVLFTLLAGAAVLLSAWLAWRTLRMTLRAFAAAGGRPVLLGLGLLAAAMLAFWPGVGAVLLVVAMLTYVDVLAGTVGR